MLTRQQYISGEVSHRDYYAQFVSDSVKAMVQSRISIHQLLQSKDPHFDDIPLFEWDNIFTHVPFHISTRFKEAGDYPTLSSLVCICKEAARQLVQEHRL